MELLVTLHLIAILPPCHLVVIDDQSEINLAPEVRVGLMVQAFGSHCIEM